MDVGRGLIGAGLLLVCLAGCRKGSLAVSSYSGPNYELLDPSQLDPDAVTLKGGLDVRPEEIILSLQNAFPNNCGPGDSEVPTDPNSCFANVFGTLPANVAINPAGGSGPPSFGFGDNPAASIAMFPVQLIGELIGAAFSAAGWLINNYNSANKFPSAEAAYARINPTFGQFLSVLQGVNLLATFNAALENLVKETAKLRKGYFGGKKPRGMKWTIGWPWIGEFPEGSCSQSDVAELVLAAKGRSVDVRMYGPNRQINACVSAGEAHPSLADCLESLLVYGYFLSPNSGCNLITKNVNHKPCICIPISPKT